MKYRLGIDLGTSSVGVAAYELNQNNEAEKLVFADSYIFGEPINPQDFTTLNAHRRSARLMRRQIARKAARIRKIAYIAKSLGITKEKLDKIPSDDIHRLRAIGIEQKIELAEFIKVLCHIVKNRGYYGEVSDDDEGEVKSKINQTGGMLEKGGFKTLGQLLYAKKQEAKAGQSPWRKLNTGAKKEGTFIKRRIIEKEFDLLWEEQAKHHPELNSVYQISYPKQKDKDGEEHALFPDHKDEKEIPLKDAFYSAMFYQRPIKWELDTVGNCSLFYDEKRAAKAQMAYQQYRIAKSLKDLRIKNRGDNNKLLPEEMQKVIKYLLEHTDEYNAKGEILYSKIYELLGFTASQTFTADTPSHEGKGGIKGELTLYLFNKFSISKEWHELSEKAKEIVVEFLNNVGKYADIQNQAPKRIKEDIAKLTKNVIKDLEEKDLLITCAFDFINKVKEKGLFLKSAFKLEKGRADYSVKALNKLTERMLNGEEEHDIIEDIEKNLQNQQLLQEELRAVDEVCDSGGINSPVIKKALREFKREMDFVLKKLGGKPEEITIELSRDIRNSLVRRKQIENDNKARAEERLNAAKELEKFDVIKTSGNIERYLLWEEQKHACPYCGQLINDDSAFSASTEVDHIIPQAKGGPNIFANKVLVHGDCNRNKGDNTPYDAKDIPALKDELEKYWAWLKANHGENKKKSSYGQEEISSSYKFGSLTNFIEHLWSLHKNEKNIWKKKMLFQKINNLQTEDNDLSDKKEFAERQKQETAWITKVVAKWCEDICPKAKIISSTGQLTAYMRSLIGFEKVIPLARIAENKELYNDKDTKIDKDYWAFLFNSNSKEKIEGKKFPTLEKAKETFPEIAKYFEKWLEKEAESTEKAYTDTDKEKKFQDFCKDISGEYSFYKRCDHRHHAIDAAIIGLCTRSLVQKAAEHYKQHSTLYKYHKTVDKKYIKEPGFKPFTGKDFDRISKLGKELLKYITNYAVWHKPDHYPDGELLQQTAYNLRESDKKKVFVSRVNIAALADTSIEKTIAGIEKYVFGAEIKQEIISQLKKHVKQDIEIDEALNSIYFKGNKVKKVKCIYHKKDPIGFNEEAGKEIETKDKLGQIHKKAYINGEFACAEFDEKTGKMLGLVPLWKYKHEKMSDKNIPNDRIRIYKGDIVFNKNAKDKEKYGVFYEVYKFKNIIDKETGKNKSRMYIRNVTDVFEEKETSTGSMKDYILIPNRKVLAEVKKNSKHG